MLILSSEVGVLDLDETKIVKKSRLEPGKMLLVDTKKKELIEDYDLKNEYANSNPYGEWLDTYLLHLQDLPAPDKKTHIHSQPERDILYKVFGYTYEDVKDIIYQWHASSLNQQVRWVPIFLWQFIPKIM